MPGRFLPQNEMSPLVAALKGEGKRVVLCNGIFDLLHVGHIRYLKAAKALGDVLVVAINADSSARRLKGPARPFMCEEERAEILCSLDCVDFVTVFEDDTMESVLVTLHPTIHAKGTDYSAATLPERDLNRSLGIEMAFVGDPKDHSTTGLAKTVIESAGKR